MIPAINGVMLAVSSSPAASIVAKVTVITALGLTGARMARRSRAAVRHALGAAVFGVLLALPVASIVAPPVPIAVAPEQTEPTFAGRAAEISPAAPLHASVGVTSTVPRPAGFSLSTLLLTAWIAGTALFLLPVVMGLWQVRRLRRSALPWRHGQSVMEGLALDAGIHRRVEVLLHEALAGPMTCGVWNPAIVLSADAQTWKGEELNRAMVHELEHVRRADWVSLCLARAVCAVYWFHPLVWIAWRRLALEAERSCDDAVLGRSEATAYADQLVGLAQRLSSAANSPLPAMANRADLATRIGAVLDSRQRRGRAGTLPVALACAAAVLLVITVSPLKVVAAQQSTSTEASGAPVAQFRNSTMLVIEDVTVSNQNGKAIEGLGAKDFEVTEDGVAQKISVFEFSFVSGGAMPSYYILGYYTRNENADPQVRKISVTVKDNPTAKVRYRPGYYANKSTSAGVTGTELGVVDRSMRPDTFPALVLKVEPAYSEEARKAKFQGAVVLSVEVNASGEAADVKVMKSLGLGLDEKAVEAVKQWRFTPGKKDGKPVAVPVFVVLDFRLL